jgi:low affinity Fe/Cu permease
VDKWIPNYNRTQCVVIDYCFSTQCAVISGMPQGPPLLFIVFINDIDTVCCEKTVLQLFSDDAKLYNNISIDNSCLTLQQSLDVLACWAKEWQLSVNISKCAVLSLS